LALNFNRAEKFKDVPMPLIYKELKLP